MNDKKNVLMIIDSPMDNAGVQNVVMSIIRSLHSKYNFDVLACSLKEGYFDKEIEKFGGVVYRTDLIRYEGNKLSYLKRIRQLRSATIKCLESNKYDIIHCNNGVDAGTCLKVAYDFGIAVRINHSHGHYTFNTKNPILKVYYDKGLKWSNKYATLRLACSNIAGKSLFGEKEFFNILNPIDYTYFSSIKRVEHDNINLMQIGYYYDNKNQLFSSL